MSDQADQGTEQPIQTRLEAALLHGRKWLDARGDEITVFGPQNPGLIGMI